MNLFIPDFDDYYFNFFKKTYKLQVDDGTILFSNNAL